MNLETRQYCNAAFVVGSEEVYFKRHLVPFGEFLPFKPLLGPCVVHGDPHVRFQRRGAGARPLVRVAGHWVGVSICYEDAFGEEVREALPEADMLVNLSNDLVQGIPSPPSASPDRPPARPGDGAAPAARHQHGHFA